MIDVVNPRGQSRVTLLFSELLPLRIGAAYEWPMEPWTWTWRVR